MALTRLSTGLFKTDSASVDFNLDSGAFFVDVSTNNVGIGTTSPSYKLHVNGTQGSNIIRVQDTGNTVGMGLGATSTGAEINFGGIDVLKFVNVSTERMRIDSSGNVGIGTSSPDRQLEIYGTNDGYMKFDGGRVDNHGYTVGTDANGFIIYDDTSAAYRFIIDQDTGYIGIGQSNPTGVLHVVAGGNNIHLERSGYDKWGVGVGAANSVSGLHFTNETDSITPLSIDQSGGYIRMAYQPAFHVDASGTSGYSTTTDIVFTNVQSNRGTHYSTSNGRFTAPVAGHYMFYTGFIKSTDTGVSRRHFFLNGSQQSTQLRLDSGEHTSFGDNGAMSIVINMNANDYVTVRLTAGSSYGEIYDYFGGYLIG